MQIKTQSLELLALQENQDQWSQSEWLSSNRHNKNTINALHIHLWAEQAPITIGSKIKRSSKVMPSITKQILATKSRTWVRMEGWIQINMNNFLRMIIKSIHMVSLERCSRICPITQKQWAFLRKKELVIVKVSYT